MTDAKPTEADLAIARVLIREPPRRQVQAIAFALAQARTASPEWSFDMNGARSHARGFTFLVAWRYSPDADPIVGEAYFDPDTDTFWWVNTDNGDYHADALTPEPYAWCALPPPPVKE